MIAKVYPMKRMPRRFSVFDYDVPAGITVRRGSCVRIPFRTQSLFGIVASVEEKGFDRRNLKTIQAVCADIQFSDKDVFFFEQTSFDLAQSVPSLLHAAIPVFERVAAVSPETAHVSEAPNASDPAVVRALESLIHAKRAFLASPHLRHTAAVLAAYVRHRPHERILIVTPNVRDARLLASSFVPRDLSLMTGEETPAKRAAAWLAFKRRQTSVLLGTRLVSLLPDDRIDAIFVVRSSHDNLKQHDRNPRYDARRNVMRLAAAADSRLCFLDVSPRVDDFAAFSTDNVILPFKAYPMRVIDIASERAAAPHRHISYTLSGLIEQTLSEKRRVILSCNKRGVARALRCRDCRHEFLCGRCAFPMAVYPTTLHCHHCAETQPLALSCPSCGGLNLGEVGAGNLSLRRFLEKTHPDASVGLVEKGRTDRLDADILVVTSHYFEMIDNSLSVDEKIGLVAEVDADAAFIQPTFRSAERAMAHLEQLRGFAERHKAAFAVQTYAPHIFTAYDRNPRSFFMSELDVRRAYGFPPFTSAISFTCRLSDPRASAIAAETLRNQLASAFPEAVFQDVRANPKIASRSFLVLVPETRRDALLRIIAKISDDVIIDTDATL